MLAARSFDLPLVLILSMACAVACAAEPQSQPATQPTTKPSNPEAHQKARKIIDEALAKYRAAKSYEDKLAGHSEIAARDKDGQDVGQSADVSASLLYAPPNRIALVTDDSAVHCDGRQLWLYTSALDQYTENPTPARLDFDKITEDLGSDAVPHPVLFVLNRPDKTFDGLFPMVREFTAVTREERDGRPGQRLAGVFDATQTPFQAENELVPFSLWFDEKTGLLGEIRLDLTALIRKELDLTEEAKSGEEEEPDVPGMPKHLDRASAALTLTDVRLDAEVPPDRFVFKPEPGTTKVDKFNWDEALPIPDPQTLIGKPAPAFAGTDLDQKPLSLEGLKGRVVVLDFWATWCVPCVQSMPRIQKIADKFSDQSVTVVGINQDARGMEKKVGEFLKDKKITFRQFADPTGKLGRKYRVGGIPCTFLIDKQGTVQAAHVGLRPDLEEKLGGQIETLLKGANLFDPEKLGQPKKEAEKAEEAKTTPKP